MLRLPATVMTALLLVHCTARLPAPGEPVRADIDDRWQHRQWQRAEQEALRTPDEEAAYEAGFAVGVRDASHRKPADPEGHDDYRGTRQRSHFLDGYEAGRRPNP